MRLFQFLFAIFASHVVTASDILDAQHSEADHGVVTLTNSTFRNFVNDNPSVFILFYAPWCFWSRQLMPQFEDASRVVRHSDPPVVMAILDGPASVDILDDEGVFLFPTMKFYLDGEAHDYEGGRHHSQIVKWLLEHIKHEQAISTPEQFRQILKTHESEVILVAAFDVNDTDDKVTQTFKKNFMVLARRYDTLFFADVSSPDTLVAFQEKVATPVEAPFLYVFNPYAQVDTHETAVDRYPGRLDDFTAMNQFVSKHRFPTLIKFDILVASVVFNAGRPIFLLVGAEDEDEQQSVFDAIRTISEEFRDRLIFMTAGYSDPNEKRLARLVGIEEDEHLPTTRIFKVNPSGFGQWRPAFKYKQQEQNLSVEGLRSFADQYSRNLLKPYLKSDPVYDAEDDTGPLKTIVGLDFDDRVRNSHSDVFITFHAPWCGHCRKLEPALNTLAAKLASVPTLMISKIDATANEVEGVYISAYPTLMLWAGGSKHPKLYNGERTVGDISRWLEENVTHKFKLSSALAKYDELEYRDSGRKRFVVEEL